MNIVRSIVVLPIRIVVLLLKLTVLVIIKLETYALAVVLYPLIFSIVACIICKMWLQLRIFGLLSAGIFVILVISVFLQIYVEDLWDRLKSKKGTCRALQGH